MPVCDACGAEVDEGARFCGECGALVRGVGEGRAPAKTKGMGGGSKAPKLPAKEPKARLPKPGDRSANDVRELRSTIRGMSSTTLPAQGGPPKEGPLVTSAVAPEPMSVKRPAPATPVPPPRVEPAAVPAPARSSPSVVPPTDEAEPTQRTEFQRLLDEVESGFDAILVTKESTPPVAPEAASNDDDSSVTSENQFDQEQARDLFRDLVVANSQSIRDFMIEVRLGEPHVEWIDHCEPAALAILRSAQGMGLGDLAVNVRRFLEGLKAARQTVAPGLVVKGEPREKLIDAYSELIAFFPEAFAAEAESNRRESVIVKALLSKVPGLFHLGVERIHATGLASLGLFYVSRPREIADLAGVSLEIAERITERFQAYRKTASELSPANGRAAERARLRAAIEEMQRATRAYDHAPSASPERRVHRRERALAMADVAIYLSRLGEVDRLRQLEKLPFAGRIEALFSFLEESERRALAQQKAR